MYKYINQNLIYNQPKLRQCYRNYSKKGKDPCAPKDPCEVKKTCDPCAKEPTCDSCKKIVSAKPCDDLCDPCSLDPCLAPKKKAVCPPKCKPFVDVSRQPSKNVCCDDPCKNIPAQKVRPVEQSAATKKPLIDLSKLSEEQQNELVQCLGATVRRKQSEIMTKKWGDIYQEDDGQIEQYFGSNYPNPEYFKYTKYSYYDLEEIMQPFRLEQPDATFKKDCD